MAQAFWGPISLSFLPFGGFFPFIFAFWWFLLSFGLLVAFFPFILAFWWLLSFHFGLLAAPFLSFWPFVGPFCFSLSLAPPAWPRNKTHGVSALSGFARNAKQRDYFRCQNTPKCAHSEAKPDHVDASKPGAGATR